MPILVKLTSLLLFLSVLLAVILPAQASFCRNSDRLICLLSIKPSAKNHWEYRAAVSIDQVTRPVELYNCRDIACESGKMAELYHFKPTELVN